MKVTFDYQIFYSQKYGGISRYFIELADELYKIENCSPKIIAPYHGNEYLDKIRHKPYVLTFGPIQKRLFYNRFYDKHRYINDKLLINRCSGRDAVLHETYYSLRTKVPCPKVITIHDMIYELFNNGLKDEFEVMDMKRKAIEESDLIIAVSENTKKDLLRFFPDAASRTFVVHHGVRPHVNHTRKSPHGRPFFLFVGGRGWYKNFNSLLEVYGSETNVNKDFDLVCFGEKSASDEEKKLINKYRLEDKVHFLSGNDGLLASLYTNASALVYLSGYEGFGMPVLEAMAAGCPVLCSNASSLPEVAGKAALMVDPKDQQQVSKGLQKIAFDSDTRHSLILSGKRRSNEFTWEKCAKQTFELYKKLRP